MKLHLPTLGELGADLFIGERQPSQAHPWAGRTVAFTGESRFRSGAIPMDREGQEHVARRAGCDIWPRVAKNVHVHVTADPDDLTGNLRRAEDHGLEIVREPDFWAEIGTRSSDGADGAVPGGDRAGEVAGVSEQQQGASWK